MAKNKLIPYWVEVREVEEPSTTWDQTNIHANEPNFPNDNLADYFEEFVDNYLDNVHIDQEDQKTFTVVEPVIRQGNTIEGRFKSGEWGRNADFWDIDEHERLEDAREENHAEEIPYYFLFHIPDQDREQALLILSKYKRKGVKTLFSSLFNPQFRDEDVGEAYMEIQPHYSDQVLEKLNEADGVASVRFRGRDSIPARERYADRQDIERVNDEISGQLDIDTELKLTPRSNQENFREMVKGLISLRNDETDEVTPQFDYGRVDPDQYSSANVTVIEGESQLTFSLWKERIQMRMDVDPDEFNLDVYGGYPTPHTLGNVARQLANDLMNEENTTLDTESLIPRHIGVPEETESEVPAE